MRESGRASELEARIGVLLAQQHALGAEVVGCLAELDALDGWQGEGYRSMAHWVSVRGKVTLAEGRAFQTAALRLGNVGSIRADALAGQLSVGVLAMAARVATPENEALVAKIVRDTVPTQAARIFAKYRECREPDEPEPGPDPDVDYWEKQWVDDLGRARYDLALDAVTGALFAQAWAAARAAGERDLDPADAEQRRRLNANEVASRMSQAMLDAAAGAGLRDRGDERFCVQVSVDLATLARVLGYDLDPDLPVGLGSQCFIPATGQRLTDPELARIMCGAAVQMVVHHDGVPLWLGGEVRTASRHQRRALRFRAGVSGCEFPGCTQTRFVDAHHVRFYRHGGPTDLDNLVLLCGSHHRQIHDHGWTITTSGDQTYTFWRGERCLGTTTRGDCTGGRPPDLAALPLIAQLPDPPPGIGPDTARATGGGERLTTYALSVYLEHLLAA